MSPTTNRKNKTMGLFGDYDVAAAADDPWAAPIGTWLAQIDKVSTFEWTDKNTGAEETSLSIQYSSLDEELPGQAKDSFVMPNKKAWESGLVTKAENATRASRIKQRFLQLEVPEDKINTITPAELEGMRVKVTTVQTLGKGKNEGKTFTNIRNVVPSYGQDEPISTNGGAKAESDDFDFSAFQEA